MTVREHSGDDGSRASGWRRRAARRGFCRAARVRVRRRQAGGAGAVGPTLLSRAVSDAPVPDDYANKVEVRGWIGELSRRLASRMPDERARGDFLATVHYEATRAGLDPQLVLGVIHHESAFRKYAISVAGARGFMQVMPFWSLIGSSQHNLFHLRTNLRYGCVILRHYLDMESGDLFRALGRYNGSLGRPEYPNAVLAMSRNWQSTVAPTRVSAAGVPAQR
jgi:soluble lytic murein transglycosylase-like protein